MNTTTYTAQTTRATRATQATQVLRGVDALNLEPDQFDSLTGNHVFSERYQARKQALLAEIKQTSTQAVAQPKMAQRASRNNAPSSAATQNTQHPLRTHRFSWKIAAAAAAICVALPAGAWAITTHADFFANAFGTGWRQSVPATQGVQPGIGDKADAYFTLPAKDFVDADPEAAEDLIGSGVMDTPLVVEAPDGHVLTVEAAVRSEDAMVYQFTLERESGVNALVYSEETNRAKGAMTSPDAQMAWNVAGDDFTYIDLERSTPEKLYGYGYVTFGEPLAEGLQPTLSVWSYDKPVSDLPCEVTGETYAIPCTTAIESSIFANTDGGQIAISPLGLVLDNLTGLFAEPTKGEDGEILYSMAHDPVWTLAVVLNYADGSSYTVFNKADDLDNTLSLCAFGNYDNFVAINMAFNRLVDPAQVESIGVTVVDVADPDELLVDGDWLPQDQWPTNTVTYTRI